MAEKRDKKAPQYIIVHIIAAPGSPLVIDTYVSLRKSNLEQIEWVVHPPNTPFRVIFDKGDGTPFGSDVFADSESVVSGPIDPNAEIKIYGYSVEVGGDRIDPGVVIWP